MSNALMSFVHYLYFSDKELAQNAKLDIERLGYSTVLQPGATGADWLVKVRVGAQAVPEDRSPSDIFTDISKQWNGEYDGWEAEVP